MTNTFTKDNLAERSNYVIYFFDWRSVDTRLWFVTQRGVWTCTPYSFNSLSRLSDGVTVLGLLLHFQSIQVLCFNPCCSLKFDSVIRSGSVNWR